MFYHVAHCLASVTYIWFPSVWLANLLPQILSQSSVSACKSLLSPPTELLAIHLFIKLIRGCLRQMK